MYPLYRGCRCICGTDHASILPSMYLHVPRIYPPCTSCTLGLSPASVRGPRAAVRERPGGLSSYLILTVSGVERHWPLLAGSRPRDTRAHVPATNLRHFDVGRPRVPVCVCATMRGFRSSCERLRCASATPPPVLYADGGTPTPGGHRCPGGACLPILHLVSSVLRWCARHIGCNAWKLEPSMIRDHPAPSMLHRASAKIGSA